MREFGNGIASVVRSDLQDVDEYDTYQVRFVTAESSSAGTIRKWIGMNYNADELTVKRSKDPIFARSVDSLFQGLGKLLGCDQIKTGGWKVIKNESSSSMMYIEVVDARDLPKENDRLRALGKIETSLSAIAVWKCTDPFTGIEYYRGS